MNSMFRNYKFCGNFSAGVGRFTPEALKVGVVPDCMWSKRPLRARARSLTSS